MRGEQLLGRRILITGAASGIGLETAELFATEGAHMALLDRNAEALHAVAASIGGTALVLDLTLAQLPQFVWVRIWERFCACSRRGSRADGRGCGGYWLRSVGKARETRV